MASSLYSNAQHVDFESVLGMDDPGMVSMFEALMASGLRGFLGCPAVVYEDALVDFFENASVRNGVVFSTVGGQIVEISEKLFAETFELPIDGLGDLSEMPKDAIFDARSIVSLSAISAKAGSFNAITIEKFSLMMAVVCGVKMNWAKFLFGFLKKMVSAKSKQAKGFAIQISLLLATFPTVELGESSEFPASKILSKKTVLCFVSINDRDGAEEVTGAATKKVVSKKRTAADIEAAVPKKKMTSKKKSISSISSLELVEIAEEAVPIQQMVEPLDVEEPRCSSADAVDLIIQQVLDETRAADAPTDITEPAVTVEKNWYDLPYDDLVKKWEAERPVVMASDTEDEDRATVVVAPADEVQQVQDFEAPISAEDVLSADEKMSLDDILLSIPVNIPLPSTCMEVTKIKMGQMIKIPGVTEKTWFLNSLPRIPADDKGKEILVEKYPVKGNPAEEHYSLICADIDLLVSLRAKVIDEVATFFNSFSLKKLASINIEEMYRKEEQVLSWGETESPQEAIQRKFYILLKYRTILVWKFLEAWRVNFAPGQGSSAVDIQVIELLSDLYLYFLEELVKEARNLGLTWTKPGCSKIFEGCPRDRGAVIARSNSNTRSLCWIRRMLLIDGLWAVEFCADRWVKIPRKVVSTDVPRQRQYDDTLPTMSIFFKLLRKRWADVCVEVVEFGASPRLLPIGSTHFCRSLQLAEPVSSFAPSRPTVFALRFSQFCSVFIDLSLFSWLPSTDISEFLSSIALDRTILRSVQRSQDSFAVAPSVQLSLEQHQSSSSSDSSSSLHFDQTDVDTTASSRPTISPDLSAVFADFQAALSEQIFASQSDISSRMHKLEQSVCDSLRDQADIFRNLFQGARQETHTLDDVHTIRFNEFRKTVHTQNATIFQGLADVRKEVDAVNAKVDIMAKRVNDIQKYAEATKEALSHQLLEFQSSAQENHNVIHAQLSELVDYIHRGSAAKKGESGSRGLQKPANTQKEGSAVTPTFEQRVQMAQRRIVQTVLDADANRESQAGSGERQGKKKKRS
ncbi:chromosome condensation complex protein [Dorcoceras hygrometricum]|uniref:Chromosome condensation complex protein n=1 Tax=Dorcoceras hygrometricum TaxID=472368 RepID=A0A2Z7AG95_9LAMI|nr:chromosome condensation complex protein [Dorcoceras hygrometricum]